MSEPSQPMQRIPDWARAELLGLVATSSAEFLYIQNASGPLVYVSPSVENILGYSPEAYVANCSNIPEWNSPRTQEALAHWDKYRDLPPGEPVPPYLIDVRHRNGTRRTHEVFERWLLDPDGERYLFGLAKDVTEKAVAESTFDHLQELTGVVNYFGEITPEGSRTLYLGPSFEAVYDMPRELMLDDPGAYTINMHPDDLPEIKAKFDLIGTGRGPDRWNVRYRVLFRDGTTHWLSNRGVVQRGTDGQMRRWYGLAEDITEQVLAEQEQRERDAMRIQSQKLELVGHLAAGVAHNFSNLLLAIQGYIGLAQRTLEPNHPAIDALSKIEEASEQARGLTRSLLTLAHRQPTQRLAMDLSASLDGAIRLLRRTLPTNVAIHHRIKPGVRVLGDSSQLDQVVLNTALNARDAMPDGGELTIELTSVGGRAVLVIADTGHGMDGPTRERAFEPFFTTKPPESGTGLGLSISRGIIIDHGGAIDVSSEPGEGTRLTISLPIVDLSAAALESEAPPSSSGGLMLMLHPPGLVRRVVKSMLDELGYRVEMVESLSGAGEKLRLGQAAGMLIDPAAACLSELDDPETALQRLLDSADQTRVAIVTDEPEKWRGLRLGRRGVLLPRPFMRVDLAVALTEPAPS